MRLAAIQGALNAHLREFATTNHMPVAYEAMDFVPPGDGAYLRPRLLPAEIRAAALGDDAPNEERGIFQVDVVVFAGTGWKAATTFADAMAVHFARGKRIEAAGGEFEVIIEKVWASVGRPDNGRYFVPVSIAYRAYTPA